jgi:siderophore ferric iron reductase
MPHRKKRLKLLWKHDPMTGMRATAANVVALGFMPQAMRTLTPVANPDLARILELARRVVPGLCGEQCHDDIPMSEEGQASILSIALSEHWRVAHREAGPHYAALRCWGLAIWQPIYLSVIAAHLDTHVPQLSGLAQPVVDGFPQKFRLPIHAPVGGTLAQRMTQASAEVRQFCRTMRVALMPRVGLHDSAADRLQAECVLGALLLVHRYNGAMAEEAVIAFGEEWLRQLGIAGGCHFFVYRARDGTSSLALDRQVCCHHFRRHDGEKCSTCPKLSLDTRIARLLADQS